MTDDQHHQAASGKGAAFFVRDAVESDAQAIVRCVQALNRQHGEPFEAFDEAAARRDLFEADAGLFAAVAEVESRVVGVALWHVGYESAYAARGSYLCDLWVDPDQRRRGIGAALVGAVARRTRAAGGVHVWWVSQPWNKPAQDFYARLGAFDDLVRAHALAWEPFERLADRAE